MVLARHMRQTEFAECGWSINQPYTNTCYFIAKSCRYSGAKRLTAIDIIIYPRREGRAMAFQRPREPETPFSSHAETEDGRIRVTVEDNGLVSALSIAPRAMRNGSDELAELVLATVRQAQTAWFRKKLDKGPEAPPTRRGSARTWQRPRPPSNDA